MIQIVITIRKGFLRNKSIIIKKELILVFIFIEPTIIYS